MGAITNPARASRAKRSMPRCLENPAPPATRMAVSVTRRAASLQPALVDSTASTVPSSGLATRRAVSRSMASWAVRSAQALARYARMVGRSASDESRCSSRAPLT